MVSRGSLNTGPTSNVLHPNVRWLVFCIALVIVNAALILFIPGPKDFTPPSVGISYPNEGDAVSGLVNVGIDASDQSGIARVEVSVNCSRVIARFHEPPYTAVWDTAQLAAGGYTLCATAWDLEGLRSRVTRDVRVSK